MLPWSCVGSQTCAFTTRRTIARESSPATLLGLRPPHATTMSTEARAAKKALRQSIKQRLAGLSEAAVAAQSQRAQAQILSSPKYQAATRISAYLSMPHGEARTDAIMRDALGRGKQVFVPYICTVPGLPGPASSGSSAVKKRQVMHMLRLESLDELERLARDAWGIPCLPADSIDERENAMGGRGVSHATTTGSGGTQDDVQDDAQDDAGSVSGLDLVVVPGVAFDADGNRTGHGAGFYDGFFARYSADGRRPPPILIGLCLAEQLLPTGQIVMQDWDRPVDAVAVGDGRLIASERLAMSTHT